MMNLAYNNVEGSLERLFLTSGKSKLTYTISLYIYRLSEDHNYILVKTSSDTKNFFYKYKYKPKRAIVCSIPPNIPPIL